MWTASSTSRLNRGYAGAGDTFAVYVRDNILATQRLLEAATRAGVPVVQASSSSVYGNAEAYPTFEDAPLHPVSPYGVSKLACESLARAYAESFGLDVVSLRYFTVYGPRQRPDMAFSRIVASLLNGRPFELFGTGEQSRDFTYVDDAVAATLTAMRGTPRSGVYNVGGGGETTLAEVIAICERLCGKRLDVRPGRLGRGRPSNGGGYEPHPLATRLEPGTALEEGLAAQLSAAAERA